jgi:hypothetical protein
VLSFLGAGHNRGVDRESSALRVAFGCGANLAHFSGKP